MKSKSFDCCVLSAGPARLGAALELLTNIITDITIINRNKTIGGLSRTQIFDEVRFDIVRLRFFGSSKQIN